MDVRVKFSGEITFNCSNDTKELDVFEMVEDSLQDIRRSQVETVSWSATRESQRMYDLPLGTQFYVVNGSWVGSIAEEDGRKCIIGDVFIDLEEHKNYLLDIRVL